MRGSSMKNATIRHSPGILRPVDYFRFGARDMDSRPPVRVVASFILILSLILLSGIALLAYGVEGGDGPPSRASDLFEATKVWSVHLRFTPEQWAKMEPKEERRPVE